MSKTHLDLEESVPPDPGVASLIAPTLAGPCDAPLVEGPTRRRHVVPIRHGDVASFMRRHFPGAGLSQWNDWRWQLANRISSPERIAEILNLSLEERLALSGQGGALPFAVTPYYASLLDPNDAGQALRRCVIPTRAESRMSVGECADPLGEDHDMPVPGVVHRYPDRTLFLVTDFCSTYCRYCTRSRAVGRREANQTTPRRWQAGLDYIAATPAIRDVLLSGGDPLTLEDSALEWLLSRLRDIPHVEMIRIGTKVPAVLPQRVTPALVRMLKRYHPLWMSLHFAHPDELTPESARACARLADAGIPLGSQTVLLKDVNDEPAVMTKLFQGLLKQRVRPYYLYQCDPVPGSGHFRTPVSKGLEIIAGLRGHTSGYAVPQFVIDAPGGGGKIPLLPEYVTGREGDDLILTNYQGRTFRYPDSASKGGPTQ
ncbi:KamA family radical SAM protein [Paucidesulfovibrio longus]|uniref:KamA family radical SAM protein n=1 Tax=Paucidesulfovibrio longus TaxID=889 RepID=UPI0003B707CE|nr:KamA family radical SAM protein [Paucidesulfovibrio longus]